MRLLLQRLALILPRLVEQPLRPQSPSIRSNWEMSYLEKLQYRVLQLLGAICLFKGISLFELRRLYPIRLIDRPRLYSHRFQPISPTT